MIILLFVNLLFKSQPAECTYAKNIKVLFKLIAQKDIYMTNKNKFVENVGMILYIL